MTGAQELVDVLVERGDWSGFGALDLLAAAAAAAALREARLDPAAFEISALFTDDAAIARLNAQFRGLARPTNVLSWPAFALAPPAPGAAPPPPPGYGPERESERKPGRRVALGDIALAAETVANEAQAQNLALGDHLAHLIAHGVLHLAGYDHETDADAAVMETLERRALATLGIKDPYG